MTLIECLVAIVVITITIAAIGPIMLFSVATRVRNQKAEQALQLAQGEIDKVRRIVEQGGDYGDDLANISLTISNLAQASAVPAPTTFIDDTAPATTVDQARQFDTDGDGDTDFLIQLFRTQGIEVAPDDAAIAQNTPVVFELGVRVYDSTAEGNTLEVDTASLTFTSGEGDRGSRPLAVMYTQVAQGDRDASLCDYWQYAGAAPADLNCN